jgi:hypothetical protein
VLAIEWAGKLDGDARLAPERSIVVRLAHSGGDERTVRLESTKYEV